MAAHVRSAFDNRTAREPLTDSGVAYGVRTTSNGYKHGYKRRVYRKIVSLSIQLQHRASLYTAPTCIKRVVRE